jgi:hypothetical protein
MSRARLAGGRRMQDPPIRDLVPLRFATLRTLLARSRRNGENDEGDAG